MTAAAWYPDPLGRHELRYWDGNAWTDHVSDGGVTSFDPVSAPSPPVQEPITPYSPPAYTPPGQEPADTGVSPFEGKYGRKHVRFDGRTLTVGKQSLAIGAIDGVQWRAAMMNPMAAGGGLLGYFLIRQTKMTQHLFVFFSGKLALRLQATTSIFNRAASARVDGLERHLENLARNVVGPRVIDKLVRDVEAGQSVKIGKVVLTRAGVQHGRKPLVSWPSVLGCAVDGPVVKLEVRGDGGTMKARRVAAAGEKNAHLLPDLIVRLRDKPRRGLTGGP